MGTFGYGPLDNDGAMDMMGSLMLPVVEAVDRILTAPAHTSDWEAVRCACWWIEVLGMSEGEWSCLDKYERDGGDTLEAHRALGIARLSALLSDAKHVESFREPGEYVAAVQDQIVRLHDTLHGSTTAFQVLVQKAIAFVQGSDELQGSDE